MKRRPGEIVQHARYLMWATKAIAAANRDWRARPNASGYVLLTRSAFHRHLFEWAKAEGFITAPDPAPDVPSFYVSKLYRQNQSALVAEARRYWKETLTTRLHDQRRDPTKASPFDAFREAAPCS